MVMVLGIKTVEMMYNACFACGTASLAASEAGIISIVCGGRGNQAQLFLL